MEVWVDGVKDYSNFGTTTLSTSLSLASGSHRFSFYAVNTAGTKWNTVVNATVSSGGGTCSAPSTPGVNVCKPVNGSTVSSPVSVQAVSTVTGTIARMEVWVDGVKKFSTFGSTTLSTSLSLAAGSHRFSFYAVNTAGTKWNTVVNATVQ
jgi:lipid-binding SYLF domain-containing protein